MIDRAQWQALTALNSLEKLLKQVWELQNDPNATEEDRSRMRRVAQREIRRMAAEGDINSSVWDVGMRQALETLPSFGKRNAVESMTKAGKEHLAREDYALEGARHIEFHRHTRYLTNTFHDHDFIEIAYVLEGNCTHRFRQEDKETVSRMKKGSVLIIPPGREHRVEIFDDSTMFDFLIRADTFRDTFLARLPQNNAIYDFFARAVSAPQSVGYILVHTEENDDMDTLLAKMVQESADGRPDRDAICIHLLNLWFLYLLRYQQSVEEPATQKRGKAAEVMSMRMFLEANCETASLAMLADRYHFTTTYVNRIFKQETGTTVQQYILRARMEKARQLLLQTDQTVTQISEQMGYEEVSYFIATFRRIYGVTPQQIRKDLRLQS